MVSVCGKTVGDRGEHLKSVVRMPCGREGWGGVDDGSHLFAEYYEHLPSCRTLTLTLTHGLL